MRNEDRRNTPVRADLVAAKIAGINNFEDGMLEIEVNAQPRLLEILWFLQWVSAPENYAGGLRRFASDLIEESKDLIGTAGMMKFGRSARYTQEQESEINGEIPMHWKSDWCEACLERGPEDDYWDNDDSLHRMKYFPNPKKKRDSEAVVFDDYHCLCIQEAERSLLSYLFELCEKPSVTFTRNHCELSDVALGIGAPWYFPRISEAIFAFMDCRKRRVAASIGETAITREVTRWLEVARCARRAVMVIGTERFGKSEAVKNWCLQNPGMARLVQTPASNAESDLLREVAKALGIQAGPGARGFRLRELIDYVLTHSGLMLVLDECQFLVPGNYSKTTAPARLNWFRRSVMDKGIPAALVATPQSYKPAKDRFVKKTGFASGQFDERILKTVHLPNELERVDLMSIARVHFPQLAEPYLDYVVEQTLATERNYVSDIEKIATLSRVIATQAGRKAPVLADIKSAIADVLPAPAIAQQALPEAAPKRVPCKRSTKPVKERCPTPLQAIPDTRGSSALFSNHDRIPVLAELPG